MPETEPIVDDGTIPDDTALWRRVPDKPAQIIFDYNLGRWRPSSAAFKDHPDGSPMSVTMDVGQNPESALAGYPDNFLASLRASVARNLHQIIRRKPLEGNPGDPHHAEVVGPKPKKVCSDMAKAATWIIAPDRPAPAQ